MLKLETEKQTIQKADIPKEWEWVKDLITEARLPNLGLPVRWKSSTEAKHMKIAFNPKNNETIELKDEKIIKHAKSPVGFITATKEKYSMPGTDTPASARYERYHQPCLQEKIIQDPNHDILVPCIAHGDYVKVEAIESDHMHAKDNILKRQKDLIDKLNKDDDFSEFLMKQPGMEKFFVKYKNKYFGTLYFYELYFNDIDNIWLICSACNSKKSNEETFDWLSKQWLYAEEFLEYIGWQTAKNNQGILIKTANKKGLAEVAIEWFWERHGHYMSVSKKLLEDIVIPLKILNIKMDKIIGEKNQEFRAERLKASLDAKLQFASTVAQAKGLGMPKATHESDHSSSDDEQRMPTVISEGQSLDITPNTYKTAALYVASGLENLIQDEFKKKIIEAKKEKNKKNDKEEEEANEDENRFTV